MWMIHSVSYRPSLLLWIVSISLLVILEARHPESGLCRGNSSISCASQLWGNTATNNSCKLLLPPLAPVRDSPECDAYTFDRNGATATDKLGDVSLKAYYYIDSYAWKQTILNITFSNIRWTNMMVRFKENGDKRINFCRNFVISSNEPVPPQSQLFYDCLWSYQEYESKFYFLHYSAVNENNKQSATVGEFLYFVPNSSEINPTETRLNMSSLFIYTDLSLLPLLRLRLQVPLGRFPDLNLSAEHYDVLLHHKVGDRLTSWKLGRPSDRGDELTYEYDTRYLSGGYYFTAQIQHEECSFYEGGCLIAETPVYFVPDNLKSRLLIGIVGCGGSAVAIFVFMYFLWRWSQKAYRKGTNPTVLLIYAPTMDAHRHCVVEFAKFLKSACNINALLDELDIPQTKSKDPSTWCNDAFLRSDFVMFLSSPYHHSNNYEGIYIKVDGLGLRNLKDKMSDHKSTQQFFSAVFPYCTERDLPPEVRTLKSFALTKDLNKMLSYLHSCPFKVSLEATESGALLEEALRRAEEEVLARRSTEDDALPQKFLLDDIQEFGPVPPRGDSSEELLLPPRAEASAVARGMFPGPLDDLNLSGPEGGSTSGHQAARKPTQHIFDLDTLVL